MTRDEAVTKVGEKAVSELDGMACDFTGSLMDDSDSRVEFRATLKTPEDEEYYGVSAYYYQERDDVDALPDGDLSGLTFVVDHYEVF